MDFKISAQDLVLLPTAFVPVMVNGFEPGSNVTSNLTEEFKPLFKKVNCVMGWLLNTIDTWLAVVTLVIFA